MKTRGERLKFLREKAGYSSARSAAEAMSVATSTYNAHERAGQPGARDFDERDAAKYARFFDGNMLWLFHGRGSADAHIDSMDVADLAGLGDPDEAKTVGSETGRRGIPKDTLAQIDVTGGMGGGGLTIVSDGVPGKHGMTFAAEHVRDYWRLPPALMTGMGLRPHDTIVLPVQGDSMLPTLNEGDFVFVDTRHRLPSPDGLYALTDEFGGIVVKRLEVLGRRDDEVLVNVISDNERHPARERMLSEVQIIGRVVRRFGVIG